MMINCFGGQDDAEKEKDNRDDDINTCVEEKEGSKILIIVNISI